MSSKSGSSHQSSQELIYNNIRQLVAQVLDPIDVFFWLPLLLTLTYYSCIRWLIWVWIFRSTLWPWILKGKQMIDTLAEIKRVANKPKIKRPKRKI